tara:strand:- start:523 stop:1713 length:1191 start_codon:yes stop_codon:yes gene_type:complete
MKTIDSLKLSGKRVLIRVDFNVPLNKDLSVADDSRIKAAIPTIKKVINSGGVAIILSHLGRPKGRVNNSFSLKHIVTCLSKHINSSVLFVEDCIGEETLTIIKNNRSQNVILLENLRFYKQEEAGDEWFARELAKLGDVYINDAFGTLHRKHASTSTIVEFFKNQKTFGYLVANELEQLKKVTKNPLRPVTAIIGGAKISSKIDVVFSLINKVDNLIIGGGMAYTFIKSMGGEIGSSLVENDKLDIAKKLIIEAKEKGVLLLLPIDSINASEFNNNSNTCVSQANKVPVGFMGLDIGEKSVEVFKETILKSKTIIWNGPMGVFEMDNFSNGTKKIADSVCAATNKGAFSLVGGGDSVAAIKKFKIENGVSYISTGGGAMLEYLEGKELPGIKAIRT